MVVIHKTPIPPPKRDAAAAELKRPTLTAEQQGKEAFVLQHFAAEDYLLPDVPEDKRMLTEDEQFWLTKECMLRYLRATKWDQKAAVTRLEETLKWRREFGFYDEMTSEYVSPENETGKQVIMGYDTDGRPAIYLLPSRQNTDGSTTEGQRKQLQFSIWIQERAIELMPLGVETVSLMIDYADKAKGPSFSTSRLWLSYFQKHYPERLGRAQLINIPYLTSLALKAIMPFVDPVTREKIKINPSVVKDGYFTVDQCTTSWGGEIEIPYEHDVYFPDLVKMCAERRQKHVEKWRTLGAKVGISEWDLRADDAVEVEVDPAT